MNLYTINNINELCSIIEAISENIINNLSKRIITSPTLWYRGQVNSEWNILPSILRNDNKKSEQVILTRPPKVRPKKSNFGGRYFYVKIQL